VATSARLLGQPHRHLWSEGVVTDVALVPTDSSQTGRQLVKLAKTKFLVIRAIPCNVPESRQSPGADALVKRFQLEVNSVREL
jgi:hypothetical protein